ncbi:MAG: hypothetical protein PVJ08_07985, partial [Dehalococcoidia bacterium]
IFTQDEYTLTVNVTGSGSVGNVPDQATYHYGDVVQLTATPEPGWEFSGWSGDLVSISNPENITITGDMNVTATFTEEPSITYLGDIGTVYEDGSGTTLEIPVGTAVAVGDTIIVGFASRGATTYNEPVVTDSAGNTYNLATYAITYQHGRSYIFYAHVDTALTGGDSITITTSSVQSRVAVASVFSGLAEVDVLDQTLQNPTGTDNTEQGNNPTVGPTGTTAQADELIIGLIGTEDATGDAMGDAGIGIWENDFLDGPTEKTSGGASYQWRVSLGYKIVQTTGEYTASKTYVNEPYWAASIATFRAGVYDLTMATGGNGSTDPAAGVYSCGEGLVVPITAIPAPGYKFDHWDGDVGDTGLANTTVTMDGDKTVTAYFIEIPEYTITASVVGGNGSIDPSGAVVVLEGNNQSFDITPNGGYQVADVLVDAVSVGAVTSYEFTNVQDDHTIEASFEEISTAYLDGDVTTETFSSTTDNSVTTVSSHTTGTGTNRLMLVGVSWNSNATEASIDSVTFTPSGEDPIVLDYVIERKKATDPRYAAIYSLLNPPSGQAGTVTVNFDASVGNGIVVGVANFAGVDLADPLEAPSFADDTSDSPIVEFEAVLDGDELVFDTLFIGGSGTIQDPEAGDGQTKLWSEYNTNARGAASTEQATTNSVTMSWTIDSAMWVLVAVPINPIPAGTTYELTMAADPVASGTTTPAAGGPYIYGDGAVVDITATPEIGYEFDYWDGDGIGDVNAASTTVTMDGDKTVTAHFTALEEYTLTVSTVGNGSVDLDPAGDTYYSGTVVTLTANADSGWTFDSWSGALSSSANPETITMDGNKTITATFTEIPVYTITASVVVGNGSIDPSGAVVVLEGNNQSFDITPNGGYQVADVLVDAVSVGAVTFYEFTNVQDDHTIEASFEETSGVYLDGAVSSGSANNVDIISVPHTTGTGENRLMLVGVSWNSGTTNTANPSVIFSYGPEPQTELPLTRVGVEQYQSQQRYAEIYSLLAPPIGETGTLTVSFSGTVNNGVVVGVANFARVDQVTSLGAFFGAEGTGSAQPSVDVTGLAGDELVFDTVLAGGNPGLTVGSDQDELWNGGAGNAGGGGSTEQATAPGSVTMSWSRGNTNLWAIGAVPINPAPPLLSQMVLVQGESIPAQAPAPSGLTVTRTLPSGDLHPGDTFDVTVSFTVPEDLFNSIGLTDLAPDVPNEWEVSVDTAWCTPTASGCRVYPYANSAEYLWYGVNYDSGDLFTIIYQVTVPGGASDGTYNFPDGQLEYYIGGVNYIADITGDTQVTVAQEEYTLTVTPVGNGSVTLDPAGGTYASGTSVQLTAVADPGWTFDGWSDDLSGSTNPETILMNGDKTVTATFTQDTYTLTVNIVGNGTVDRDDPGPYYYNDIVELTANPDPGWTFIGWTGDLETSDNPDNILIDGNKTVTATFTQEEYTLTVNIVGNGTVDRDDPGPYNSGDEVELTANPDPGWTFSDWSGDLSGSDNPKTITIDGNNSVTATFTQE